MQQPSTSCTHCLLLLSVHYPTPLSPPLSLPDASRGRRTVYGRQIATATALRTYTL